jgi:hypothetical protein
MDELQQNIQKDILMESQSTLSDLLEKSVFITIEWDTFNSKNSLSALKSQILPSLVQALKQSAQSDEAVKKLLTDKVDVVQIQNLPLSPAPAPQKLELFNNIIIYTIHSIDNIDSSIWSQFLNTLKEQPQSVIYTVYQYIY